WIVFQLYGRIEQRLDSSGRSQITRENNTEIILNRPGQFGRNPLTISVSNMLRYCIGPIKDIVAPRIARHRLDERPGLNQQGIAARINPSDEIANHCEKVRVPDEPCGRQTFRPQILNPYSQMSLLQPCEQYGRNDLGNR